MCVKVALIEIGWEEDMMVLFNSSMTDIVPVVVMLIRYLDYAETCFYTQHLIPTNKINR